MVQNIIQAVLKLLAGMGVFLVAMRLLTQNLESLAGNKIKSAFEKISKSNWAGLFLGTAVTALVQSSGAVSVMTVGFVDAGFMTLKQAATIIYGANIGTTINAQIVALGFLNSGSGVAIDVVFGALAGVGALIMLFAKNQKLKKIGAIAAAFGMMFVGLSLMTASMGGLAKSREVSDFLYALKNPALLLLAGIALTAVLQSSSAMNSLTIAMIFGGLLSLNQGIYLIYGSNIGTCFVALLACAGSGINAKRTGLIHLLFNVFGVAVFISIDLLLGLGGWSFARILETVFPLVPATQLAMMHTFFNTLTVVVMLPLTNLLIKLVVKLMPEKFKAQTDGQNYAAELEKIEEELNSLEKSAKKSGANWGRAQKQKDTALFNFMSRGIKNKLFALNKKHRRDQELKNQTDEMLSRLKMITKISRKNFKMPKTYVFPSEN